ncbi:MAG: TPM domain-containing protein, partial [Muribaculaceae bacterium]|nr:TPM domain-containing protein [Muribaculaceae bacterium]
MYRKLLLYISILLGCTLYGRTPGEVPNVHVANASAWVSDPDGIMSPEARRQADFYLQRLQDSLTVEVPVVIVANLSGQDIDSYATELFEQWGIGKRDRDNGLLLLISRDDRKAAIRTGYGTEGVINDGRAGRVIRQAIAPAMKEGDADSAVLNAVAMLGNYLKDPEAADYLYSSQRSNAQNDEEDFMEFLKGYGTLAVIAVAALILLSLYTYFSSRKLPDQERYRKLNNLRLVIFMAVPLTLGIGVISWGLWWFLRRHVRLHPHPCPNCGTLMHRVDEVHDNDYLTPAQDMEEKLNSVDYDVWLCPSCNETDIIPYVNSEANYSVCPN